MQPNIGIGIALIVVAFIPLIFSDLFWWFLLANWWSKSNGPNNLVEAWIPILNPKGKIHFSSWRELLLPNIILSAAFAAIGCYVANTITLADLFVPLVILAIITAAVVYWASKILRKI
jgi:hypothetical protein